MNLIRSVHFRADEKFHDWRWRIHTYDLIELEKLGLGPESLEYCPTPYAVLRRIFRALPASVREGTFLDYGCGMGRSVIAACRGGFRKAIGVEISGYLCEIARRNARGLPVEIVQSDAALFRVPADVSVVFFFNPFRGHILTQVLDLIEDSLIETDRPIVIVYFMRKYFEEAVQNRHWIRPGKVWTCEYPKASWAIYHIDRSTLMNSCPRVRAEISPE
jgi:SAM-dependent methyltransferase